ncbi:MAG: cobalamin-dependent protein, partial [Bdellovibrionota bacterium]
MTFRQRKFEMICEKLKMDIDTSTLRNEPIAFVVNPSIWYKKMYPTGILVLSDYLASKGFSNQILDSKMHNKKIYLLSDREQMLTAHILKKNYKIICFSSTHKEFAEIVRMNHVIKSADPSLYTIVGGSQPTYRHSDYLNNGFDFICLGEGEKTLTEFCSEVLNDTRKWESIPGLVYKHGTKVIINKPRNLMSEHELDKNDFSAYQKIDPRYLAMNVEVIRGVPLRTGMILTTRGCPYSCSFCGCPSIFGSKLRFRPLDSIDKEIAYLKKHFQIEGVWIVDDTFTVNRSHSLNVAKILKKHNII